MRKVVKKGVSSYGDPTVILWSSYGKGTILARYWVEIGLILGRTKVGFYFEKIHILLQMSYFFCTFAAAKDFEQLFESYR